MPQYMTDPFPPYNDTESAQSEFRFFIEYNPEIHSRFLTVFFITL